MFQEKCYPYWYPKGKVLLADSLSISVLHEKVYAFYTTRNIKIEDREVIASMYFTFCISIKVCQKMHDFIFLISVLELRRYWLECSDLYEAHVKEIWFLFVSFCVLSKCLFLYFWYPLQTKECRLLCHFQFTRWTDRAIPYPSELVQFYRTVRRAHDSQPKSTLLVHCRFKTF